MRRLLLIGFASAAAIEACSLTTSLSGLSSGSADPGPEGDASPGNDGPTDGGGRSTTDAGDATATTIDGAAGDSSAYRAMVMGDGPVLYYRLSDRDRTAKDEMGHRDGTYVGNVDHAPGAIAGDGDTALSVSGDGSPTSSRPPRRPRSSRRSTATSWVRTTARGSRST